jgi:hypothetical protein
VSVEKDPSSPTRAQSQSCQQAKQSRISAQLRIDRFIPADRIDLIEFIAFRVPFDCKLTE